MPLSYDVRLYEKVKQEYDEFINSLEEMTPKEIIDKSYEKVFKEEIVNILEYKELNSKEAKALYLSPNPLNILYEEWRNSDYSYMEMLEDAIDDCRRKSLISLARRRKEEAR